METNSVRRRIVESIDIEIEEVGKIPSYLNVCMLEKSCVYLRKLL